MTLDRDFIKFTAGPSSFERERPRVTINHKGQIYLNRKAYAEMGKPGAVHLYYSSARQVIAVEPCSARLAESFPVKPHSHGGGRINAQRLCRHHRLNIQRPEAFNKPEIDRSGILLLDLQETTRIGGWTKDGRDAEAERAERRRAVEERRIERERKQLLRHQEREERARRREKEKLRREIDRKNAAELARREAADLGALEKGGRRQGVAALD